jgi:hypothetical protein
MPKILTVGNEEFEFPVTGENPGYGSEVTDWAEAVTGALSTVQKPNDILTTSAPINNTAGTFNVSTAEVISIDCKYFVSRTVVGGTKPGVYVEIGFVEGFFDGTNWGISIRTTGDAKILLSITPTGQLQYTLTEIFDGTHTGSIVFEAKVINNPEL